MITINIYDLVKNLQIEKEKLENHTRFIIFPILVAFLLNIFLETIILDLPELNDFVLIILILNLLIFLALDKKYKVFIDYLKESEPEMLLRIFYVKFLKKEKVVINFLYKLFEKGIEGKISKKRLEKIIKEYFNKELKTINVSKYSNRIILLSVISYFLIFLVGLIIYFIYQEILRLQNSSLIIFSLLSYFSILIFLILINDIEISSEFVSTPYWITEVETEDNKRFIGFLRKEDKNIIVLETIEIINETFSDIFPFIFSQMYISKEKIRSLKKYLVVSGEKVQIYE